MSRYVQKISLQPFTNDSVWIGWELEGQTASIDGLVLVDDLPREEIARLYGVTDFQKIPFEYLQDLQSGRSIQ